MLWGHRSTDGGGDGGGKGGGRNGGGAAWSQMLQGEIDPQAAAQKVAGRLGQKAAALRCADCGVTAVTCCTVCFHTIRKLETMHD